MNLAILSCFRNSSPEFVRLYCCRVSGLLRSTIGTGLNVELLAAWGDSTNDTRGNLMSMLPTLGIPFKLVERHHGFPDMGSSEHPDRLRGFAFAANGTFESVSEHVDAAAYIESDLIWQTDTLLAAIRHVKSGRDVVAVPVFCGEGHKVFYDIWGFRGLDGERYGPFPPHHRELNQGQLTELSAAGSFLVMSGAVARACRCSDQALVGFCADARAKGFKVWTDWGLRVYHP